MGLGPEDKLLLYPGRLELEKNVPTLLKIFSVVRSLVPNLNLALVGTAFEQPFTEFGVYPVSMMGTLTKICRTLGIPEGNISFHGQYGAGRFAKSL